MSTDQPDAKKPLEGQIDLKKTAVNEKPLTEKNAAATAAERWQAELAKAQLPSNVKVTMAHPGDKPHGLQLMLANAEVPKSVQPSVPGAEVKTAGKEPVSKGPAAKEPAAAAPEVKAAVKPPENKPAAQESGLMSAVHWAENKTSSAVQAVKNFDFQGTLQAAAANPGSLTNGGLLVSLYQDAKGLDAKQVYENIRHTDAKTVAKDIAIAGGALVAMHFVGAAGEKVGLKGLLKGAESEEGGVANQILEGKTEAGAFKTVRTAARVSSPQAVANLESFGAQLDAASHSARVEFSGATRLTSSEGLGGESTRLSLRPSSSPVLETPINRLPVTRTPFGVTESGVPKIPVGLKTGQPLDAAALKPGNVGSRVPTFKEFSAEPPRVVGQQVRLAPEQGSLTHEIKGPEIAKTPGIDVPSRTTSLQREVLPPAHAPGVVKEDAATVLHEQPKPLHSETVGAPAARQNVTEPIDVRPSTNVAHVADTHIVPAESRIPGSQARVEPAHVQAGQSDVHAADAAQARTAARTDEVAAPTVARTGGITSESPVAAKVAKVDEVAAPTVARTGAVPETRVAAKIGQEGPGADIAAHTGKVTVPESQVGVPAGTTVREANLANRTAEGPVPESKLTGRTAPGTAQELNASRTAEGTAQVPANTTRVNGSGEIGTGGETRVVTRVAGPDAAETLVGRTAAGETAALQPRVASQPGELVSDPLHVQGKPGEVVSDPLHVQAKPGEVVSDPLHVQGKPVESGTALRTNEAEPANVQSKTATSAQSTPLPRPLATAELTGAERTSSELPQSLEAKEPVGGTALRASSAESAAAHADLTTGTGIATETRAAVQQSATELKQLQTIPGLSSEAAQTARTLETNLTKMTSESAGTMSVNARTQAMSDIENGLKNLKSEVKGVEGAEQSLSGIDNGVTRLRAANDAALSEASTTATKAIVGDLKTTVQAIPNVESGVAQSINHSLERIAAPEASAVEKRAALDELSTNVEKLRTTTEPQTFAAMEKQVTELRTANSVGETVRAQTEFETSATRLGDAAKNARTALGSDAASAPAVGALQRIEENSATLAASRATGAAERQAAMTQIEADMGVLSKSPAAAEVPQLERELAAMRSSETSVNLLKSEATFAEATPKFSSAIEEALAKPGISTAERTQLEALRTTAAKLEPSTYQALSGAERANVLTEAESQVASLERQTGEAAGLRTSFNEVKASANDLEGARVASAEESAAGSPVIARTNSVDPALSQPRVQTTVTDPAALEPKPLGVSERAPLAGEGEVAGAAAKPSVFTARVAADADNAAIGSADAAAARTNVLAENETIAARAARTGEQGLAAPLASDASATEAASVRAAAQEAQESRLGAQTGALVKGAAETVEQSTKALSDSVNAAITINETGGLGAVGQAERRASLAAMRQELDASSPNIASLKREAAALPAEAATPLLTRVNGLASALESQEKLNKAVDSLDLGARTLSAQLNALKIPGMASTINDLKAGVASLSDARDRAAVLKSMADRLATLSPDVARRLGSTIDELQRSNDRINASLVDVITTHAARARDLSDLSRAKDSLRILTSIVPDGSATSQLIKSASDQLTQAEKAQQAADAALEAKRSVFAFPTSDQQMVPVRGLQTNIGRLFSLQSEADAIAAARYPRSFAAASAPLMLTGGSLAAAGGLGAYAYLNQSPSGTISGPADLAYSPSDRSALNATTAGSDQSGVSNQSAFSLNTDAALSPLTMAAIQDQNIQYNFTLAPNWEAQNKALGYFATPFSPEAPKEEVAQTVFTPVRKLNLSTSTTGTDVKPRLVYPGFAQRQLNEMAAARRRGGLLSVFADNSTGVRGFGTGLQSGPQSGTAARIPTGLSKLLTREIISNGLDANGETTSAAQGPSAHDPNAPAVSLSLANEDNTPPGIQSSSATASLGANRAKSVAV
jgi:hypothetical protein